MAKPGVKKAALGYYRAMFGLFSKSNREAQKLFETKIQVPTLAMTGAWDGCMDTRLHDDLMYEKDFPAGLKVVRLQDAGHFLHQEKPDEVNRVLLEWLSSR